MVLIVRNWRFQSVSSVVLFIIPSENSYLSVIYLDSTRIKLVHMIDIQLIMVHLHSKTRLCWPPMVPFKAVQLIQVANLGKPLHTMTIELCNITCTNVQFHSCYYRPWELKSIALWCLQWYNFHTKFRENSSAGFKNWTLKTAWCDKPKFSFLGMKVA